VTTASGLECDDGQLHDVGSFECQNCGECAQNGPCFQETNDCVTNDDCNAFIDCYSNCNDDMCAQECVDQHMEGFNLYLGAVDCIYCQECPHNCDAGSIGCPFQ
jgi:hypothetical protein